MQPPPATPSLPSPPYRFGSIGIIGCGRVGAVLLQALRSVDRSIVVFRPTVVSPATPADPGRAKSLAALVERSDTIILTVPDDVIPNVARECGKARTTAQRRLWIHMSGSLPASVFAPICRAEDNALAIHPLQTFGPLADPALFRGVLAALDGSSADALLAGAALAAILGMEAVTIPPELRPVYHAAGAFASGFIANLLDIARELMEDTGLPRDVVQRGLTTIAHTAVTNALVGPESTPTGPVVRGDTRTVATHLSALERHHREFLPLYRALSLATLDRLQSRPDGGQDRDAIRQLLTASE